MDTAKRPWKPPEDVWLEYKAGVRDTPRLALDLERSENEVIARLAELHIDPAVVGPRNREIEAAGGPGLPKSLEERRHRPSRPLKSPTKD